MIRLGSGAAAALVLLGFMAVMPVQTAAAPATTAPRTSSSNDGASATVAPDRIIVKLKSSVRVAVDQLFARGRSLDTDLTMRGLDQLGRRYGLHRIRPLRTADARLGSLDERVRAEENRRRGRARAGRAASFTSAYVFELAPGADVEAAAAAYRQHSAVEWAEPDHVRSASFVPNDPYLLSSGAWNQPFRDLWGLDAIDASSAWDVTRGDGVTVAIVDTGIDLAHPDIAANVWVSSGEIAGNGIDDDGNGFVDDVHGWNFVNGATDPADPSDDYGHGTIVAGIVAATGDNQLGMIGVAWNSRVMAVKGLDATGSGYDSDLADAILYAAENGAAVINASWGARGKSQLLAETIETVTALGVVFVAAAGNDRGDISGIPFGYPESYPANDPHAIAVAASDHDDQPAFFTSFGQRLDLTAPGGGDSQPVGQLPERSVLSLLSSRSNTELTSGGYLVVGQNYIRQAGTSLAAPFVSGAAALLASVRPELDVEQVRQALRGGADDVGPVGFDDHAGAGRLNAARALQMQPLAARILTVTQEADNGVDALVVRGSVYGPGFVSYTLEGATDLETPVWTPIAGPIAAPVNDGELGRWTPGPEVVNGRVLVRLIATGSGGVFEDRFVARVVRARITSPGADEHSGYLGGGGGGPVAIRGSVSVPGLVQYRITYWWRFKGPDDIDSGGPGSYRSESSNGITLANGGTQPVSDGVLATLDPSVFPGPSEVHLRLTVETAATTYPPLLAVDLDVRKDIIIDSSVRAGWPRLTRGTGMTGPVLADLDGDGQTEVVALGWDRDYFHTKLYVFEPDGSDRPGWPQPIPNEEYEPPFRFEDAQAGPSAADLDGDGRMEIVVVKGDSVCVFHDDARLADGWPRRFRGATSRQATLVDLDGDGTKEIVFAYGIGADGSVRLGPAEAGIHAVRMDGSELAGFPAVLTTGGFPSEALAVGDVTGDGKPDIAVIVAQSLGYVNGEVESQRTLFLELVGAAGAPLWSRPAKLDRMWVWVNNFYGLNLTNEQVYSPIMTDADGDGMLDIVVNSHRKAGRLYVFSGDGRSHRIRIRRPKVDGLSPRDVFAPSQSPVTSGDVDGDGIAELSVTNHFVSRCNANCRFYSPEEGGFIGLSFLHVLRRDGRRWSELPRLPKLIPVVNPFFFSGTAIADLDGDGAPDLTLVPSRHHTPPASYLSAFRTDGSWIQGFPKAGLVGNSRFSTSAVGDLDGDGLVELVTVDGPGLVIVWNTPGLANSTALQWPMTRHDARATGALAATQ